jgi:hypothetical protein
LGWRLLGQQGFNTMSKEYLIQKLKLLNEACLKI